MPQRDTTPINENIRASEMLVVGPNKEQLGLMKKEAALEAAAAHDMDLVCVAPTADPVVCRIMDYGKYRFEKQKHERESRKKQAVVNLKEIRFSANIGDHDFETKLRNARRFVEKGDKVKASVRFRGREMANTKFGREVLERFAQEVEDLADIESMPKLDGRQMFLTVAPKKK